jgi:hypothetical protein
MVLYCCTAGLSVDTTKNPDPESSKHHNNRMGSGTLIPHSSGLQMAPACPILVIGVPRRIFTGSLRGVGGDLGRADQMRNSGDSPSPLALTTHSLPSASPPAASNAPTSFSLTSPDLNISPFPVPYHSTIHIHTYIHPPLRHNFINTRLLFASSAA